MGSTKTNLRSIAVVGNHLPRQCGLATFTTHLIDAIRLNEPDIDCWSIALNDQANAYQYPERVKIQIDQDHLKDYRLAADRLNLEHFDVVCVQHEYGIYGGESGSFIIELLSDLKIPVVTTLHTLLIEPTNRERRIVLQLAALSDRLIVMSQRSSVILRDIYNIEAEKIQLIHHGIPDVPLLDSSKFKDRFGVCDKQVILTFGLISPSKGIETVIDALPDIIAAHPDVIYMVVGATHPHHREKHGEEYRISLHMRAKKLNVEDHVIFHDQFVTDEELKDFIGAADIYITPYQNEAQIISGPLSYAVGMGKAVISTPYWHAQELLAEGRGCLFPFRDHQRLAEHVIELLDQPEKLKNMQTKAYDYGRQMVWEYVGKRYLQTFEQAKHHRLRTCIPAHKLSPIGLREQTLPEIRLHHLRRMTDGVGILQHSKFSVPDRNHGYCIDDNARALIVVVTAQPFKPRDRSLIELASTYLSFIAHALKPDSGLFQDFMSYDRHWLEDTSSEDSHGRIIWSLGTTIALCRNETIVSHATYLFHQSLHACENFTSPRAVAFAVIGLHAYLSRKNFSQRSKSLCQLLTSRLLHWYEQTSGEDWPWFENTLTYDNARLPQALLLSAQWLQDSRMLDTSIHALTWLKDIQHDESGRYFSAVGNHGWYKRGGKKAQFDQQPIEAAAMLDASVLAFNVTGDDDWLVYAYRCLNWYLCDNELHLSLYDHSTGGCRDGLQQQSVNENQGAESTLCWLMALLGIYRHRGFSEAFQNINNKKVA